MAFLIGLAFFVYAIVFTGGGHGDESHLARGQVLYRNYMSSGLGSMKDIPVDSISIDGLYEYVSM